MEAFTFYEAQENSDMTEGRGHMRAFAIFVEEDDAVQAVKGKGVMGFGDGEVVKVTYEPMSDGTVARRAEKVYGYHRAVDGKWRDGYVDDRDFIADPEWVEYVRLKNKFGG